MFQVEALTYLQGGYLLFQGLDFEVIKGKITAIFGASGSGKTTLLHLLAGRLASQGGVIKFEGKPLARMKADELVMMRRRLGFLLQSGGLFTHLDVLENVLFPLRVHTQLPESLMEQVGLLKVASVGLKGFESKYPHELSGGMVKRAALARALVLDPNLIILDEPFAGQDPNTVQQLMQLIRRLNATLGTTILLVSHDLPESLRLADYAYFLKKGRMVEQGSTERFLRFSQERLDAIYQTAPSLLDFKKTWSLGEAEPPHAFIDSALPGDLR